MKIRPSFSLLGIAALYLGCASVASAGRPEGLLRCEARPYSSASGLVKVEIREPAVVLPAPVQAVRPEPLGCSTLAELLEPDPACAAPAGPVCAYLVHPTAGAGSSALPDGKFPVVLFSHGNNAPVPLYEGLLKRLAHEGFIVVAPCCPSYALTAGDEAIWIERLEAAIGWLELANAGRLSGDSIASRLAGHVDLEHIGVAGHSRGAAESVRLFGLDPRIKAGVVAAPAANNQGQCPQSPLCTKEVIPAGGSGKRPAEPTDALDRCCHAEGLFGGGDSSCPSTSPTPLSGCTSTLEIWTPVIGGQVFADPIDLIPKVDKPLRVLAAEHDGAAQPFGDKAEGTHGGFKRRPVQTSIPTGCFWQEGSSDQDGDGTAWEYGFCDGRGQRDGVEQVYEANRGPSQFLVIDKGLHCGFNQTMGVPAALCDGPPHQKVYSFDVDPATGSPVELSHIDPRVQFELFTEAAVEFFKLELGGCDNYLWNAWYDIVPGYRKHLSKVGLRPSVEILKVDTNEVVLPPGGERKVQATVRNVGPAETTVSFSLLAGPDEAVGACGAETSSGWCFEAPAATPLGPGETRQIELRVAAPGKHPKPLTGARLFVRDDRGHDAASTGLGLTTEASKRTE